MVCVWSGHHVTLRRSTHSSRGMWISRWSRWSRLGFGLVLLLLLPVTSTTVPTSVSPAVSGSAATANTSSSQSSTTAGPSSPTTPLTTAVLNTTTTAETSATSANMSTTTPAMTTTTQLHNTDNTTTENTPHTSTESTTTETTPHTSTESTTTETTPHTSTESTTTETTPHTSTESTTTETNNTTFPESTTNSTAFPATPDPSSSAYTNNTTPLLTTLNQSSRPAAHTPCNLSQSCLNVFYWMTVELTGPAQSQQILSAQLKGLFRLKLDVCKVPVPAVNETYPASRSSSSDTTTLYITSSSSPASERLGLFEDMELTCGPNITQFPQCHILLKLGGPADVCCVRNALMSSGLGLSVLGHVERVGVCADDMTQISAGQYDKCNQSVKQSDVCGAKAQNISCGNSTNVIFPFDTGAAEDCPHSSTSVCYCSSHCNSSDFYYHRNVTLTRGGMEGYESQILKLLNVSACRNTSSVCNISQTFITHIRDSSVVCESRICEIIVKLDTDMDVCDVRTALNSIFESQEVLVFDGDVIRVAICYNTSLDPLRQTLRWQPSLSRNFSSEDFCRSNRENFDGYCSEGSTVVPLNSSCNISINPSQNTTTTAPSSSNTTNSTAAPPSAPANGTASGPWSTSGPPDADGLLSLSVNASSLNASQVDRLISQLELLLSGPNISLAVANTSVNIVNNLLDVPAAVITPFSKRVIGIVDAVGLKLVVSGTSQAVLSTSLALAVKRVDGTNFQETTFSLIESSNLQVRGRPGPEAEGLLARAGSSPLGSVVLPASLTQNLTAEQQQLVSRVQFNFFQKSTFFQDKSLGGRKLNSGILGSSVANLSLSGLQKEVLITLRNTEPIPANYVATCVFWDFSLNGGSGGWSSSGCRVLSSSAGETLCACDHLTSFGVLLDISKTPIPAEHLNILTYITYIGCGVSAIFLSATLLTYLAFGKLRKDIPSKILIQLCVALLLLNLVFLLDAWLALFPQAVGLCISTAFFLHYFLLASFTWMALEAVHMYLALVKVFNTYISRFMVKIGFAGWGIPLIVVIIVIAVNKDNYGLVTYGRYADGTTDDFCWIRNDIAFYVAVVAYFCVVFLVNLAMFIVVMIQLCRIKRQNPHNTQHRSGWQDLRSVAGLTVLLGLTWGFAFFAWGPVNLAFMYLFAIFNTLQGFFIFVFHCALKENVRRQWRTYLCCGRLRLSENSEWSRTATQKIHTASKQKTSFLSSNSNNSSLSFLNHDSLAPDVPMAIGNPMDDRIITAAEEPVSGSDVELNEINDQYRGQRSY